MQVNFGEWSRESKKGDMNRAWMGRTKSWGVNGSGKKKKKLLKAVSSGDKVEQSAGAGET